MAVLEVGLGGRLDATNIVDADVGVVCSIGLDHVDWLGDSLDQIGREKAGIFRAHRPAVLGSAHLPGSVWQVIEQVGAAPVAPENQYRVRQHEDRWDFEYGALSLHDLPMPALAGEHQVGNAAAALAALVAGDFGMVLTQASVCQRIARCAPAREISTRAGRSRVDSGCRP